ncbi:MAG: hypothetical protein ACQEWU_19920 [Bacillota bacterium]|uniref:hypothetical protein n=1 Tax=Virgibacillus sp. AGTR TaxID=2812055 RepID=UPI001962DE43|nr:hypothetical protein [Virgibacillus sp. AGTR]MCC2252345.1 hypothetical protein [Virgibacillus sp. AGTR]QRZ18912.1 hypothetical protein JUJ52_04060 [Virgibacillus sp. AGTR]
MHKTVVLVYLMLFLIVFAACETDSKVKEDSVKAIKGNDENSTTALNEAYNDWELTPTFEYHTKSKDGEDLTYEVIGKKDAFGITGPFPIVSSKSQKYFWFYWGQENIKNQPVEIMALKKGAKDLIKVFSGEFYSGAQINKNEVNMPSNLLFPSPGVWNVLIFIDDELTGNIVVEVVSTD